jgi:hypothetical protein
VDLVFFGHVHNYERTCAVYQENCNGMPVKDANGIDVYDNSNYTAPVHAIVGAGGFSLDNFPNNVRVTSHVCSSKQMLLAVNNDSISFMNWEFII